MMKYFELLYVIEFVEFTLWRAKNVVSKVTSSLNQRTHIYTTSNRLSFVNVHNSIIIISKGAFCNLLTNILNTI